MKITVGHLMIVAGVVTYVVLGPLGGFARLDKAGGKGSAAGDDKPLTTTLPPVDTGAANPNQLLDEKLPAGETAPAEKAAEPVAPVAPAEPAAAPPVAPEPPAAKPAPKPHRRRRAKPIVSSASGSGCSAAQNLVGSYVSLKLANGREVKGALVEQSSSFYKIELPGLGAMSYPVRDVVSIAPAQ